ncbi:hypothetical protein ZWY2020_036418 [Hordeum vulgare]|nr:hypothetical protein ZWY2020_036418 [Hordeum vulgare]
MLAMRRKKRLANGTMHEVRLAGSGSAWWASRRRARAHPRLPTHPAGGARDPAIAALAAAVAGARARPQPIRIYNCNCKNRGVGVRFPDLCTRALARFPTFSIPSISLEFCTRDQIGLVKPSAWYAEAMERAVGSVSVTVPRGAFTLSLPRFTRAEALSLTLTHRIDLKLPDPAAGEDPVHFGRLTELALATLWLPAGTPPLHGFLSSSCPRLRRLRLCCVRGGEAVRALLLRSDALEALDLNNVEGMARLDVAAPNLLSLSVRSCFRFPRSADEDTEAVVSAPRMESICWYRSYPKRLSIADGSLARVRRLSGLKLATLGRSDRFDFPYTMQLLQACSLTTQHLELDLVMPDEMALHNWLGPEERGSCEDLMRYVPPLPRVTVLSLTVRWGIGGDVGVGPCLASLLSRVPSVATIYVHPAPYSLTVLVSGVFGPIGAGKIGLYGGGGQCMQYEVW